ncbi:MAG: hypothetical protein V3V92_06930 [Candidatus Hydrothermarchaeales archaeon]
MHPLRHIIISGVLFTLAYVMGLGEDFVIVGFIASILIDIDHFGLRSLVGSYNPLKIHKFSASLEFIKMFKEDEIAEMKILGTRLMPLHNIWVVMGLIVVWPAAGLGVLVHIILDLIALPGYYGPRL